MNLVDASRRAAGTVAAAALLGWAPCALGLAPDADGDGIPDSIEIAEGRNPAVKDNDIFADASLFVRQQYRDMLRREVQQRVGGREHDTPVLSHQCGVHFGTQTMTISRRGLEPFVIRMDLGGNFVHYTRFLGL